MDIISITNMSLIVLAFLLFTSVLMYGDIATRQARRAQASKAKRSRVRFHTPSVVVEHRDAA